MMGRVCAALALAWIGCAPLAQADPPGSYKDMEETGYKASAAKKAGFVIAPIPQSSPALGNGLALVAAVMYQPKDAARPWTTGLGGLYTDTESWAGGAFQKAYFGDDYRLTGFAGYGAFNLDFFGIGAAAALQNNPIKLNQSGGIALLEVLRRVRPNVFIGARFQYLPVKTRLAAPDIAIGDYDLSDVELSSQIVLAGLAAEYDTRDNEVSASRGVYTTLNALTGVESLGSDFSYAKVQATANWYHALGSNTVVAARGALCYAGEGGPFYDLCMYGQSNDLRGYSAGRFRDRALLAAQVEWRQHLFGRFGVVAFAGVGGVAEEFSTFPSDHLLPAAGVGIRFAALRQYKVNLSVDYAVGDGDNGVYVYIGEAF